MVFCELGGLVFWPRRKCKGGYAREVVRGDGRACRAFGELSDDFGDE